MESNKYIDTALTSTELHLQKETTLEVHHGIQREYVHSVQFPMDKQAVAEVDNLKKGTKNFVQMEVDPNKETIDFVKVCFLCLNFVLIWLICADVFSRGIRSGSCASP